MIARIPSLALALLVLAAPACVINGTRPLPAPPPPPAAVTGFDAALSPYGDFIVVAKLGRVWRPRLAVVGPGFVPYVSGGRWVLTSEGWVFESRWDFGWAVFHYGQWVELPDIGWAWFPGDQWAPAWVEWQYGGGYVAWAPVAPVGVFVDWRPRWCFVEARWMAEDAWIEHHLMPRDFHPATPVAPVARRPGHVVSVGPPPEYVGHSAGIPVRIHEVTPPPGIGRTKVLPVPPLAVPPPPPGQPAPPARVEPPAARPAPVGPPPARTPPRRVEPPPPAVKPAPPAQPAPPGQPAPKHQKEKKDDGRAVRSIHHRAWA